MNEQDRLLIQQLLCALIEQSQAIQALADSNMELVQAMAEGDEQEEESPTHYLDGQSYL